MKKILVFGLLLGFLFACEDPTISEWNYPRLKTLPIEGVTRDGATFEGEFVYRGDFNITSYGFAWSRTTFSNLGSAETLEILGEPEAQFSARITSQLAVGETHVRAFVTTPEELVLGPMVTFQSQGSAGPQIVDIQPRNVSLGDTVRITGNGFSNATRATDVRVDLPGVHVGRIVSTSSELIEWTIPLTIEESSFRVLLNWVGGTVPSGITLEVND